MFTGMTRKANIDDLRVAFRQIDNDEDGKVTFDQLHDWIRPDDKSSVVRLSTVERKWLDNNYDKNKDGQIDFEEFQRLVNEIPKPFQRQQSLGDKLVSNATSVFIPESQRQETNDYLSKYSCLPPPLFMLLISIAEVAIFIYYSVDQDITPSWNSGGCPGCYACKECSKPGILVFDPLLRNEAWRFISYIFIHAGLQHIIGNLIVQLFLGIPLELVHRFYRIGPIYILGAITGSMMQCALDPKVQLVGASGGGYALITAHLSNVILNWKEMSFAWIRMLIVLLYVGFDFGSAIYRRYALDECDNVSYLAHLGGALCGLLLGTVILRNLKWHKFEIWISVICGILYLGLIIAFIVVVVVNDDNTVFFTTSCVKP